MTSSFQFTPKGFDTAMFPIQTLSLLAINFSTQSNICHTVDLCVQLLLWLFSWPCFPSHYSILPSHRSVERNNFAFFPVWSVFNGS